MSTQSQCVLVNIRRGYGCVCMLLHRVTQQSATINLPHVWPPGWCSMPREPLSHLIKCHRHSTETLGRRARELRLQDTITNIQSQRKAEDGETESSCAGWLNAVGVLVLPLDINGHTVTQCCFFNEPISPSKQRGR